MTPDFWNNRRVYITGHTGFKGSWLSYWLSSLGAVVTGYSLAPHTAPSLFHDAKIETVIESELGDIRDLTKLTNTLNRAQPEIVFHLAAQPLVRLSYKEPIETFEINALGTANLLQAIRSLSSVRAVICVTTDKCYENCEWEWPYRENDRLGGSDPYAASKACAEIIVASYKRSFFSYHGAPGVATARGGNVIGGGDWSEDRIIPDLVRHFVMGKPAQVRNPSAVRPWQSVLDALHGYLMLAEKLYGEPEDFSEAWNIGPPATAEMTVREVANAFAAGWGNGASWEHKTDGVAPHEANLLKLDSSKARARLGWRDLLPTDVVISDTASWYADHFLGRPAASLVGDAIKAFQKLMESCS
uniref:CDP-glucose 4,6-dehydratase n=1 Tax=mine drainage metagenome TaxID=410659 RepID=E6Q722_9ZZZZ